MSYTRPTSLLCCLSTVIKIDGTGRATDWKKVVASMTNPQAQKSHSHFPF